jgi:signal transduction histidine kinase
MTSLSRTHPPLDPAEVASALRLLGEAIDQCSFFTALREVLPRLLPATRVDIVLNESTEGDLLLLTCGDDASTPPPADKRTPTGVVEWLSSEGYGAVSRLPLNAAGRQLGWLLLARRDGPIESEAAALAGQLIALIGLRLVYDQSRGELAERETYSKLLEQRLRDGEAVRLRATMAAGAAHDISNLLAAVLGYVELIEQNAPATMRADLQAMARAASDGQQLVRRLLSLNTAKPIKSSVPVTLMPTVIRDAIKLVQPFLEARPQIIVKTMLAPVPPVRGNAAELREVLVNLIMNAIAAMPEGGVLTLRTYSMDDHVLVAVNDTGEGIAREYQGVIFQPFVTTREEGSGLGLSVSRAIVESYGGTLTVESMPGAGATFTIALPSVRSLDALHEAPPLYHTCAAV